MSTLSTKTTFATSIHWMEEGRVRDNYGDKGGRDNDDCGMGITDNNMDDDNLSERGAPQHSIYRELVITWGTTR